MMERSVSRELLKRIKEPRKHIQVIMGPRQVGKTTMALQLIEKIHIPSVYASADGIPAAGAAWLEQIWETANLKRRSEGAGEILLVIDEIQKIPDWSEKVKQLWDKDSREDSNTKVVILGSSRLLLQKGLTESLAGRFETIYMGHWSFREMNEAFGWDAGQFVWFGGYPGGAALITDEERWKNYIVNSIIETSVSKDILMLTRVDKPALMKRLFELGCHYSGQVLSLTKIQGQLQDAGNTTTLSHYLNLLSASGLLSGIEKYGADIIRKRSSSPRFQVHNNALLSAQRNDYYIEIRKNHAEWGRVVESAIGAHLLNNSYTNNFSVYYWRDRNDEVDFVLERRGRIIAVEVKSNASISKKGMDAFRKKFSPGKIYQVSNNTLPWDEFLKTDPLDLF